MVQHVPFPFHLFKSFSHLDSWQSPSTENHEQTTSRQINNGMGVETKVEQKEKVFQNMRKTGQRHFPGIILNGVKSFFFFFFAFGRHFLQSNEYLKAPYLLSVNFTPRPFEQKVQNTSWERHTSSICSSPNTYFENVTLVF